MYDLYENYNIKQDTLGEASYVVHYIIKKLHLEIIKMYKYVNECTNLPCWKIKSNLAVFRNMTVASAWPKVIISRLIRHHDPKTSLSSQGQRDQLVFCWSKMVSQRLTNLDLLETVSNHSLDIHICVLE